MRRKSKRKTAPAGPKPCKTFYGCVLTDGAKDGRAQIIGVHEAADEALDFCVKRGFLTTFVREIRVLELDPLLRELYRVKEASRA